MTTTNSNTAATYSHVFLRIQPYFSTAAQPPPLDSSSSTETPQQLQFLLYMFDPEHKLTHTTVTQPVPSKWLPLWDEYYWVEDLIADSLRVGVEVLGQEYVVQRMGWGSKGGDTSNETSTSVDPGDKEDKAEGY